MVRLTANDPLRPRRHSAGKQRHVELGSAHAGPRSPNASTFRSAGERTLTGAGPVTTLRLETAETGNEVRYRVRERLVEANMPNDGISVRTGAAHRRDCPVQHGPDHPECVTLHRASNWTRSAIAIGEIRYVRERILEANDHPLVELAPTAIRGVKFPLPTSGSGVFELLGNLTIRGVTRPTVWKVDARFAPDGMTGTAATAFTFEDFGLTQPRVPVLLSVADTIRLEYTFRLVSAATLPNRTVS